MSLKKISVFFILFTIIFLGFWFRLKGILDNHSFWADEAYVSSLGRDMVLGKLGLIEGISKIFYEPLYIALIAFFFKLMGVSEYAARFPSVVFGTLGILFAYLVATKLSDEWGGVLAAFLYGFTQFNLTNATQAKPYAILETFFLISIYLLLLINSEKKSKIKLHVLVIIVLSLASFIHLVAIFLWIPYLFYLFIKIKNKWLLPAFFALFILVFRLWSSFVYLFTPVNGKLFFAYNNTTYLRELVWENYGLIFLPAFFGIVAIWRKNRLLVEGIFYWLAITLFFWNFRNYSHNIRYLVPVFGTMFVFFGIFWSHVGNQLFRNKSLLVTLIIVTVFFFGGNKVVRKPALYYSPNNDLYGDVQTSDYKLFFAQLKKKFPDYKNLVIFNDIPDAQSYYLDKQPDAYFSKTVPSGQIIESSVDGKMIYSTLDQFLKEKAKYKKGLLIVEDWESLLPDDIKNYAKKHMRLMLRIEGLTGNLENKWPLELYSWGI